MDWTFLIITVLVILYILNFLGRRTDKAKESHRQKLQSARENLVCTLQAHANTLVEKKRYQERCDVIEALARVHVKTLYAKRLQTVTKDAYGNIFDNAWQKEKEYFYDYVIRPKLGMAIQGNQPDLYPYHLSHTSEIIEEVVNSFVQSYSTQNLDVSSLTPYEFEAYCTQLLNDSGWSARTTQGSGDQGIDIVGEKNGITAVFQVKQYSSPVGNKAVQEAIAGKAFASADLAFVVSNASYTPSAVALANASSVRLLHYSELNKLDVSC